MRSLVLRCSLRSILVELSEPALYIAGDFSSSFSVFFSRSWVVERFVDPRSVQTGSYSRSRSTISFHSFLDSFDNYPRRTQRLRVTFLSKYTMDVFRMLASFTLFHPVLLDRMVRARARGARRARCKTILNAQMKQNIVQHTKKK